MKQRDYTYFLPQSEEGWLESGQFKVDDVIVNDTSVRVASVYADEPKRLVVMSGGIPRDEARREKLPLINKLYGHLGILLAGEGSSSLLYNQPGTGRSGGEFNAITFADRISVLASLAVSAAGAQGLDEVALIGMSAGSYMACRAAEAIQESGVRVGALVLQSPAAYPISIESMTYGRDFTDTLSCEWDIFSSPVFDAMRKMASDDTKVIVSFFEKDDPPIPAAIQDAYAQAIDELSSQGHAARLHTIYGVEHNFRRMGSDHGGNVVDNDAIRETAQVIKDFIHAPTDQLS